MTASSVIGVTADAMRWGVWGAVGVSRDYPRLEGRTYEKNRTNMQAATIGAPVGWNQTQRLEIDLV